MSEEDADLIFKPGFSYHLKQTGRNAPGSMILAEIIFTVACIWAIGEVIFIDYTPFTVFTLAALVLLWILKYVLSKRAMRISKDADEFTYRLYKYMVISQMIFTILALYIFISYIQGAIYHNEIYIYLKMDGQFYYSWLLFLTVAADTLLFVPLIRNHLNRDDIQYQIFSERVMKLVNRIDRATGHSVTYSKQDIKNVKQNGGA